MVASLKTMDRQIVCYQIPAFEIAIARLQDASLRDRPVAVVPSHTPRALIHQLSSQAKHEGLSDANATDPKVGVSLDRRRDAGRGRIDGLAPYG